MSVVTPFYNTGEYLERCIETVLGQTFHDFEYILVDNQSTDDGGRIAANYAAKDDRIKLITTPRFFSQVDNFNFALRQISPASAFCKMVLADDWLYPQCLAEMVALAEAHPNVGLVSSYSLAGTTMWGAGLPVERSVFSGRETAREHLVNKTFLFGNHSTVMYRSDVVRGRDPFYTASAVFFDTDAALRILADNDFGFIHQVLSYLRVHPGSITARTSGYSPIAADHMIAVRNHGATFMSPDEYRRRLRSAEGWFYEGLGRQRLAELFSKPDSEYWEYQRRYLTAAGQDLQPRRVWVGAARAVAIALGSPVDQLRQLKQRRRARR